MSKNHVGFVGVYEFARLKGWSVDWVYKQIQAGRLKAEKRGRKWQIPASEAEGRAESKEGKNG